MSIYFFMEIDNKASSLGESIVFFPRSYNKRGEERLHSVQGVTLDGREINVKLRIDESMLGKESTPSIAEFSREDVKAKNPCLASPENSAENREGILLFTGCEVDKDNRRDTPTYIARWAYVLASHSEAQSPVFGIGRVVIIADNQAVKTLHQEIEQLEVMKPEGWEALLERKRKTLSDPLKLSYFGHLYQESEQQDFAVDDRSTIIAFADKIFSSYTKNGVVGGLLIRLKDSDGKFIHGYSTEIFPRWIKQNQYQSGSDVMKFFFKAHDQRSTNLNGASFCATPIMRYASGPSFKNYYFLKKPEDSMQKIRKHFLINNEPTVCNVAFSLSRREESGDCFMLKYYPLSSPISTVALIGESLSDVNNSLDITEVDSTNFQALRPKSGIGDTTSLDFPSWYLPELVPVRHLFIDDSVQSEKLDAADAAIDEVELSRLPAPNDTEHHSESDLLSLPIPEDLAPQQSQENGTKPLGSDSDTTSDLSDMVSDLSSDELAEAAEAEAAILAEVEQTVSVQNTVAADEQASFTPEASAPGAIEVSDHPDDLVIVDSSSDSGPLGTDTSVLLSDYSKSTSPSHQSLEEKDSPSNSKKNGLAEFLLKRGLQIT